MDYYLVDYIYFILYFVQVRGQACNFIVKGKIQSYYE